MSARLDGMDALLAQLQQMGRQVDVDLTDKALIAGADHLVEETKKTVAWKDKTGNLREHITRTDVIDGEIEVGIDQQGDAFYGLFLEVGRSKGTYRKKGKTRKYPPMKARPWMQPTFENNVEKVQEKMADVIKQELNL